MNILIGLVIGGVLLALVEARHQGIGSRISSASPGQIPPVVIPPSAVPSQVMIGSTAVDAAGIQVGSMGLDAGLKALNVVPVVGQIASAAFQAISGIFLAGHIQRQKEAISENAAVDNFITRGFDPGIAKVVNAYNYGQVTGQESVTLLDMLWKHYWAEVSGQIQPGRNGCNSGAGIDYSPGHPPTGGPSQHCAGSWGAACCIGAEVIGSSIGRLQQAIATVEQRGGSQTVVISKVYPSKYSRYTRESYPVTVQRPS